MDDVVQDRKPIDELIPRERVALYQSKPVVQNDWSYWQDALGGKKIETERGNPRTGYYRSQSGDEVIAIWRDDDGNLLCRRSKYGDGSKLSADEIDELFGWICHYPIPYELFVSVIDGGVLPPEHRIRLTTSEIQAGVVWTSELGKRKLALDPEHFDENGDERPGRGHNNPPEDLPPDQALTKRIHDLGLQLKGWLDKIGGRPSNQAEAEILGGYANSFKDLENQATAAHKAEKTPHLEECRRIDAKWFAPVRDKAIASRDKIIAMIREFERAEDARKAAEARAAQEAAAKAAAQSSVDMPAAPIEEIAPEPTKVSTLRGSGKRPIEKLVVDLPAFLAYCAGLENPPPDLVDVAEKVARKFKAAGVKAPGMVAEKKEVA